MTNILYIATVAGMTFSNVIEVVPNHAKKQPPCTLIRYIENKKTNEFHAWAMKVDVKKQ